MEGSDKILTKISILYQVKFKKNTQILKALEHLAQVNKAEHDMMTLDLAEISGEVKSIQKGLATVELVTANNWSDIVKLKSVK